MTDDKLGHLGVDLVHHRIGTELPIGHHHIGLFQLQCVSRQDLFLIGMSIFPRQDVENQPRGMPENGQCLTGQSGSGLSVESILGRLEMIPVDADESVSGDGFSVWQRFSAPDVCNPLGGGSDQGSADGRFEPHGFLVEALEGAAGACRRRVEEGTPQRRVGGEDNAGEDANEVGEEELA